MLDMRPDLLIRFHTKMSKAAIVFAGLALAACNHVSALSATPVLEEIILHEMITLDPVSTSYTLPASGALAHIEVTIETDSTGLQLETIVLDFGKYGIARVPDGLIDCIPGPFYSSPRMLVSSKPFGSDFRVDRRITLVLPFAVDRIAHSRPEVHIDLDNGRFTINTVYSGSGGHTSAEEPRRKCPDDLINWAMDN